MRKKKTMIIIIMCVMILLMGTGYAILSTQLHINGTSNIDSNWNIMITNVTSSATGRAYNISAPTYTATSMTFNVGVKEPGDKMTFTVTVKNNGSVDAILDNIEAINAGSNVIKYSISGIQAKTRLAAGATKTFTVITEFDITATSLPDSAVKEVTIELNYIQDNGQTLTPEEPSVEGRNSLVRRILADNQAQSDAAINFGALSSDTNGKGLYYTTRNTEGNKTSYYFRGDVQNNYVSFAGQIWRVIRINEDRSVRMIKYDSKGSGIGTSKFNPTYTDNAYLGYMHGGLQSSIVYGDADLDGEVSVSDSNLIKRFIAGAATPTKEQFVAADVNLDGVLNEDDTELIKQHIASLLVLPVATDSLRYEATHRNVFDSTVKTQLDAWYQSNLASYSAYLADAGFCNDRSLASGLGYKGENTSYGATTRAANGAPQFKCPNETRDLFTTSLSTKGNKALTYPIGLITVDEVMYSGEVYNLADNKVGLGTSWLTWASQGWTMTPQTLSSNPSTTMYTIGGATMGASPSQSAQVHYTLPAIPVINLNTSAEVESGTGTSSDPYVIYTE